MNFEELNKARKILKLDSEVTVGEIKESFRRLVKKTHPDVAKGNNRDDLMEKFKEVSWAYEIIMNYISSYKLSFKKEDFDKQHIDFNKEMKDHMGRFFEDWLGDLSI